MVQSAVGQKHLVVTARNSQPRMAAYAAFFPDRTFAHLARWAAAILRLPSADIVRLSFAIDAAPFAVACLAHRAFCARLIFLRAAADIVRVPVDLGPLYAPTKAVSAAFNADNCCSI